MKQTFSFLIAALCMLAVSCTNYEKLASSYIASQNLTEDQVLFVEDGDDHYILHFEASESKKYSGRKIAKYDFKTQEVEKISSVKADDTEIDLTKIKEWGCSKDNSTLYFVASVGNEKCLYSISPYTMRAKAVCYGKNIEIIGDIILCLSQSNVVFYKWSGKALKTDSYTGTIGKTSVTMDLALDGGNVYGYYYARGASKNKKNFRGTIKGVNMEMSVFNSKGKEIETIKLSLNGDVLMGNCHDIAKWKDSNVKLTYSK